MRFTKIDLHAAYNLLQIALDEEWKIVFRTCYDHFEYLIISFELINVPIIFQSYINSALQEYLDDFYITYLDDILIYSNSSEEYIHHIHLILEKL